MNSTTQNISPYAAPKRRAFAEDYVDEANGVHLCTKNCDLYPLRMRNAINHDNNADLNQKIPNCHDCITAFEYMHQKTYF
ncbi:hypothetical protein AYI69_g1873 [Smittium culicis]|uniref:Uncharacterized protein n=1 Tax=Smittium culicis TaxID=133412 RepID=A0A1R1YP20_9FUNG|nr:hypothetical protein AYI69_g1873 [Smittium culicis]